MLNTQSVSSIHAQGRILSLCSGMGSTGMALLLLLPGSCWWTGGIAMCWPGTAARNHPLIAQQHWPGPGRAAAPSRPVQWQRPPPPPPQCATPHCTFLFLLWTWSLHKCTKIQISCRRRCVSECLGWLTVQGGPWRAGCWRWRRTAAPGTPVCGNGGAEGLVVLGLPRCWRSAHLQAPRSADALFPYSPAAEQCRRLLRGLGVCCLLGSLLGWVH